MGGEKSKSSGEIGEAISNRLLDELGWAISLSNVPIECNNKSHLNEEGNRRKSHGDDKVFVYTSPFHDDRVDVVHVQVKNHLAAYPKGAAIGTDFRGHFDEIQQIVDCARRNPKILEAVRQRGDHNNVVHTGLLVWIHNNLENIEEDIIATLANSRLKLDPSAKYPVAVIDNARASFLLRVLDDINRRKGQGTAEFDYPQIGTSTEERERPRGKWLPLELICSNVIPVVFSGAERDYMVIYTDQEFSIEAFQRLFSYGIRFSREYVREIHIGMTGYSQAVHQNEVKTALIPFSERKEKAFVFSLERSILDLLDRRDPS